MNLKKELQQLNNKLDKYSRQLAGAEERKDEAMVAKFKRDIAQTVKQQSSVKKKQGRELSQEKDKLAGLGFHRELTKKEQADMGKLKKSVRGLVVVHPLTALGKQMGLKAVTGYAEKKF